MVVTSEQIEDQYSSRIHLKTTQLRTSQVFEEFEALYTYTNSKTQSQSSRDLNPVSESYRVCCVRNSIDNLSNVRLDNFWSCIIEHSSAGQT